MKRKYIIIGLMLIMVLTLCGCGCKHEWSEATCESPRTCANCDDTEGEALGHDWLDATCESPKTCARCGLTEGEALGHDWLEATCESPKTCARCELTEGEALGHDWLEATCESPMTCARCELTEDNAPGHDFAAWTVNGDKMSRECSVCGETEEADYDVDRVAKSLLKGLRSFNYMDHGADNVSFGANLSPHEILPHTLGDNNPGGYIVFDDEGKGTIYKVKPNPDASDTTATDAYIFEAIPVSVKSISRNDMMAQFFNVDMYLIELSSNNHGMFSVILTYDGSASGDCSVTVIFYEPDDFVINYGLHSHERLIFTGTWSNDSQDTVNFADDGSFTASIKGNEYEGVWLARPARENNGVSTLQVMLCYELEGVLHTQYAVTDVPNEKEEAFYDIAESIDVSALELTVRFGNNEATLTKNT